LFFTFLAPRILRWLLEFGKFVELCYTVSEIGVACSTLERRIGKRIENIFGKTEGKRSVG
jgi:hypothetical protein